MSYRFLKCYANTSIPCFLRFALLCFTDVVVFTNYKSPSSIRKKMITCSIAILYLLWRSRTKPTISPRYAYIDLISPYHFQCLLVLSFLISAKQVGVVLSLCSCNFNFPCYTVEWNISSYIY